MSEQFLLKKRGYFYRPNARGYTADVAEAGLYDRKEAEERARMSPGVTMHPVSEFIMDKTGTVNDIPDAALLKRAVRGARSSQYHKRVKHPRWVAVMDTFSIGSTYAHQLCRRFGFNPDELVSR